MTRSDVDALLADPVPFLRHEDAALRRLAVSASVPRLGETTVREAVTACLADEDPTVRAEAVEVLGGCGDESRDAVFSLHTDPDARVVEAVATALGEIASPEGVPWLVAAAQSHEDRMVREAAVAALGAIGDPRALPVLLDLVSSGPPQVRRRAVVALTVFDAPEVEPALRAATRDRNPMVREVADMVVGRDPEEWTHLDLRPSDDAG